MNLKLTYQINIEHQEKNRLQTLNTKKTKKSLRSKNIYLYNGKELDEATGLYYYGARYYDAEIGRFMKVDPIAEDFVHVTPYNYAENSPIANIDLWGLQKVFYQLSLKQNMNWWHSYAPTRMVTAGKKFTRTLKSQKKYNVIYHQFGNTERPDGVTHRFKNYDDFKEQKYGVWGLYYINRKGPKISEKTRNNLMKAFGDKTLFTLDDREMKNYFADGKELIAIGINSILLDNIGKSTNKEDKITNNLESSGTLTHEEDAHAIRYLNNTESTTEREHKDYQNLYDLYSPTVDDILTLPKYRNTQAYKNLNELINIINKKYE